jgi:hypothetical protein
MSRRLILSAVAAAAFVGATSNASAVINAPPVVHHTPIIITQPRILQPIFNRFGGNNNSNNGNWNVGPCHSRGAGRAGLC